MKQWKIHCQKVIDDEKYRINNERETKQQIILQERAVKLVNDYGMTFTGDHYILNNIKISVIQVKTSDDFVWNTLVAQIEKVSVEIKAAKAEAKRLEEEETIRIKEMAEANMRKEAEIKKREEEIAAREKAAAEAEARLKAEAEAAEKAKIEAAAKQKADEQAAIAKAAEDRLKARKSALFAIGFASQGEKLVFQGIVIPDSKLSEVADENWDKWLEGAVSTVTKKKEEMEQERVAREEKIRKNSEDQTRLKLEAEQKEKDEIARKAQEAVDKLKIEAEAEAKRQADIMPDVDKFNQYLESLKQIPVPEFSTDIYKAFGAKITTTIKSMVDHLNKQKPI